jgi:hypothetical protein
MTEGDVSTAWQRAPISDGAIGIKAAAGTIASRVSACTARRGRLLTATRLLDIPVLQEDIDRARKNVSDAPAACRCPLSYAIARAIGYHTSWTVSGKWAMSDRGVAALLFDDETVERIREWDYTLQMTPFIAQAEHFNDHYEFKRAAPPLFDKQQIAAFLDPGHAPTTGKTKKRGR